MQEVYPKLESIIEKVTYLKTEKAIKKELNSKEKAEGIMLLEKENGNIRIIVGKNLESMLFLLMI